MAGFQVSTEDAIRAGSFDGDLVIKRIELCHLFATYRIWRAKLLSASAVVVASGEMAAWVVAKHSHHYFAEHASDGVFLPSLIPLAVSVTWQSHTLSSHVIHGSRIWFLVLLPWSTRRKLWAITQINHGNNRLVHWPD
jgi:hypothetical protein